MPSKRITKKPATEPAIVPFILPGTIIPEKNYSDAFPIVGIGASAGGLAAFEAFFSGLPSDIEPGMAFVLVQHLAPDHKSLLTELIRRCTRMQVFEVEDGMVVQRNCVYIIPPNHDMAFLNGTLHLLEPSAPRGQRLPIDFFFRSLAQDQCECAIGIVLSGTGSDGTLGVRAIKGEGGMVIVQVPETSDFDGMPRSVIATGLADYVLPPAEMAAQLIAYAAHAYGKLPRSAAVDMTKSESALKKIFILLRSQTGHDFSNYKPSTINRRIDRRMAVHQIAEIGSYMKYLQQTPSEAEALFRDLLIGVTNFFRDPEVFELLEKDIIPKLFASKPAGGVVRVWSTGCSTGEEAYSIAILLQERMETLKQNYTVQVFATDIDSRAIAIARAGLYPASIAADITPERLARFFSTEPDGCTFRIHKSIRDMLVFSEQDVIKDPPFSKLDLISCRNLLIYLGMQLQKRLIPLFHYALKPDGILLLGTSEGVGDFTGLFPVLDRKSKLFQRKENYQVRPSMSLGRTLPRSLPLDHTTTAGSKKMTFPVKLQLRELTEQALLQQLAASSALVNWHGDILYLHGRTGMYLELTPGEVGISNILKMAREGLRRDLTMALHKAVGSKGVVRCSGLRVQTNGHFTLVNLTVSPVLAGPLATPESYLYLVILEEVSTIATEILQPTALLAEPKEINVELDAESRIAILKQELRAKDEYLQSTHEELESSNEELKSSNEEMQSVNEELQSTNEELETSKEELQSVNEELATVNNELQTKVIDLSRANNDMNNLLAGTGIGTVFVDYQLRILRFTPAASTIINLIPSDVGRPVAHIVSNLLDYDSLVVDTQEVLNTLIFKEVAVQTVEGLWYTMRIQPYRTLDNVIEGAVISFIDITETVRTRNDLHKANKLMRLAVVVRDAHDAITMQNLQGSILAWNPGAVRIYGWSESEALAMNVRDRIPLEEREEALVRLQQLSQAEILEPYSTQRITKQGSVIKVSITSTALLNEVGEVYAIATTERAIREITQ
ncbi:chemotaxis protein CheB [Solimicrobium silvestre]|uniref:protein-glutamate O-methyltransferase n=1 Tax=Solimicrobium silvestre TaxID=2099400 RepID=A0A2S9GUY0_9BURK|nr:chemotaxis protein CheB [Solimicrobium silvestre]PRC91456.1 PAS domain S-box protein [Solimicrobium silvestre]